jgi:hypothetical protein
MSTEITINQDIVEVNVTEEVITIEAPSGAYPLPSTVYSVFGRTGNVVAQEGDYTLTQLGDVTLTSPANGQVLKYNGTQWVNGTDTDTGLTSVGLSMPSAFSVANSPLTANGTLSVTGAGTTAQYVRGDGTLATFPVIAQEAQRLITEVYNSTGATLAKGSIVYINGGQGNLPTVTKAIATGDATSAQTYGVVQSDITNMNNGFVVAMGSLTNLDTQVYPVGTQLYLSGTTAGAWTSTKPYAPLHLVYVGIVVRSHPTQGVVEIRIQNGYELDELHDVSAQSPTNGDILQYVAATDLWTKAAGTTTNIAEGTNLYFTNARARAAISLTTTGTSGASTYNNTTGVLNIPQYQGVLTNPVTGTGTTNTLPKFTGASTIGNSNVTDSGSLITLASSTTITSGGGLGIGISSGFSSTSLNIAKGLTGSTSASNISAYGEIKSDVTSRGFGVYIGSYTQAAAFTLANYYHYYAEQGVIGAGSTITTQTAFYAHSNLTGATTNYGFRGSIPSGTNRWNIYMDGTAANYLAGDTGIGTTSLGTATQLTIGGTETAVSAIGRGQLINTTLVASANNDVLVGLDIQNTFTNGAFTGVSNFPLRIRNTTNTGNVLTMDSTGNMVISGSLGVGTIYGSGDINLSSGSGNLNLKTGFNVNTGAVMFNATRNFTLQNGGTFTDAGFRLDVNGTTRFIGTASSDSPPLGSELLTTSNWTSTGWTGDFTTGFTHTTGNTSVLSNTLAAVIGTYYKIQITRSGGTAGSITIGFGGQTRTVTNTRSFEPLATTTGNLTITPTSDFDGTILVSVKTIGLASPSFTISPSTGAGQITMRATNVTGNTVIGLSAGQRLSSSGVGDDGANNTFIGNAAGRNSTFVRYCTFIGTQAGELNVTGTDNTSVGYRALYANTIGLENVSIGKQAGENSTGSGNTFVGSTAGQNLLTGGFNIFIGNGAGRTITGGSTANTNTTNSIYIGQGTRAAADNQNNQIVIGQGTTGLGANTTVIGNSSTTITGLYGNIRLVSGMGTAPASATATGTTGDIVVTAGFIYVCTATNTWVRTILTTF